MFPELPLVLSAFSPIFWLLGLAVSISFWRSKSKVKLRMALMASFIAWFFSWMSMATLIARMASPEWLVVLQVVAAVLGPILFSALILLEGFLIYSVFKLTRSAFKLVSASMTKISEDYDRLPEYSEDQK